MLVDKSGMVSVAIKPASKDQDISLSSLVCLGNYPFAYQKGFPPSHIRSKIPFPFPLSKCRTVVRQRNVVELLPGQ